MRSGKVGVMATPQNLLTDNKRRVTDGVEFTVSIKPEQTA